MSSNTVRTERAATPRWQRVLGGSVFLYPPLMHVLIVNGELGLALAGLAAMGLIAGVLSLRQPHARLQAALYFLIAVAALVGLGTGSELALYLPPVMFNLMFAVIFGHTLRPGATPLIEPFMRLHYGDGMPDVLYRYARRLTSIWTFFFVATALTAVLLAVFAPLETWSLFANVLNYLLIVVLFVGQFVFGYFRYRALRPRQILPTVARMAYRAARRDSFDR